MVRRVQPKPVTAQMYRHFAILTVAVTLVVGVFADGESREAVASEVRAAAPAPRAGPTELVRHDRQGSFGPDDAGNGDFGAPMDSAGAAAQEGFVPVEVGNEPAPGVPAGFTSYGVSQAEWSKLTAEQRKIVIARHEAEERAARAPERAEQIDSLLAASRARSGEATSED